MRGITPLAAWSGISPVDGVFCLVNKEHSSQRAPNYYHVAPVRDFLREAHPANTRLMTSAPLWWRSRSTELEKGEKKKKKK